MNLPEVSEVLLVIRKYKCVTVFFMQSLPGLTLSLKGVVVCVYLFIGKIWFSVFRWNFNHQFCTSLTTCALAFHTNTPLIHKYKHKHATPQVFKTNAEFPPRLRDILQVLQTCLKRVF